MRIVIDGVGRSITEFTSTRELVLAIRVAIKGHKLAWERAGVLHRDVSLGNILIVDDSLEGPNTGFLHDFDYSEAIASRHVVHVDGDENGSAIPTSETENEVACLKGRIGPSYFMAVELLSPAHDTLHEPHHDLESFYWVLLWVVLRHTDCTLQEFKLSGQLGCKRLFNALDNYAHLDCKRSWISQAFDPSHGLDVARNAPLTELLKRFKSLIARIILYIDTPQSLTHQAVLAVFDEALAMDGWPQNDWNPCTLLDMDPCPGFTPLLADIPRDFPEAVLPRSR
ncbi:hypothetical protein C8Q70DRAFT_1056644 [Cubamyces menziesii]|nr:hypothetical protein C8Q70DRAFT_1056644 [Cubamyces menziesii]